MLSVSKSELYSTLENFSKVTGLKTVMYDAERNIIATYPNEFEPFCSAVRKTGNLKFRCLDCDRTGFDVCDSTLEPYIYKCHMNITEAIAPILANGIIIGYLMFGQVLQSEDEKSAELRAQEIAEEHCIDSSLFTDRLSTMRRASGEYLLSALKIMCMCAAYLYTSEIIKNRTDVLACRIREYVQAHISEDLSSESLCSKFYVSRSKLYKTVTSEFGMGISEYVKKERIALAAKKLTSTTAPISQIASEVGIPDANYFTRIFRTATGKTPNSYRNDAKGHR